MKLFGTWRGYGKRLKNDAAYRMRHTIYDQVFDRGVKVELNTEFIEAAGLDNPNTFDAVTESLKTDYGVIVDWEGEKPQPKPATLPPSRKSESKTTAKTTTKGKAKAKVK